MRKGKRLVFPSSYYPPDLKEEEYDLYVYNDLENMKKNIEKLLRQNDDIKKLNQRVDELEKKVGEIKNAPVVSPVECVADLSPINEEIDSLKESIIFVKNQVNSLDNRLFKKGF